VVGLGTLVRFLTLATMLTLGYLAHTIPGIVVGTGAVICGVVCEATYIGWRTRPVVRGPLARAPAVEPALTFRAFGNFYVPLAMTALMQLGAQPLNSAFLSRMPRPLESLALWPVLTGALFIMESMGIAYNEVVVALLDQPGALRALRRFTVLLVTATTSLLLLLAATPLAELWFGQVAALASPLVALARGALWLALPVPALVAMQSWFQGTLLFTRRTRGISEAVGIAAVVTVIVLGSGVALGRFVGLDVGIAALTLGYGCQTGWLWWRSRSAQRAMPALQAVAAGRPAAAVAD
jgi:progressive ankylosis protein